MKNVLNLCLRYYPASGGAEDLNRIVLTNLKKYNINFINFTTALSDHIANKKLQLSAAQKKIDVSENTIRFSALKIPKTVYHIIPQFIINGIRQNNIDLIHAWTMMYFPAFARVILKYLKNKPVILNAIVDENNIVYRKLFSNTLGKLVVNYSDCVVLLTEYSREVLEKYKFEPKNIEIIPAGVDVSEFDNCSEKSQYISSTKINILFVGRIAYGKGLDLLLNAVNILKKSKLEFQLNIVGPDFGMLQYCEKFISENNLENEIKILGKISRTELVKIYKSSDIFILPSRYEAFGIVLIEAMAAKLPIISTNCSSIKYVVENEKNGCLIEQENYIDLAEKLRYLINNPQIRVQFGEYGYIIAQEKYSLPKVIEKYYRLYSRFF